MFTWRSIAVAALFYGIGLELSAKRKCIQNAVSATQSVSKVHVAQPDLFPSLHLQPRAVWCVVLTPSLLSVSVMQLGDTTRAQNVPGIHEIKFQCSKKKKANANMY